MKSVKEISVESKILKRLQDNPNCLKLVNYLFEDEELQEMQEYANNVSIKRLGYNDHGPVHMRQVAANAIKMLNILQQSGIQTSLDQENNQKMMDVLNRHMCTEGGETSEGIQLEDEEDRESIDPRWNELKKILDNN